MITRTRKIAILDLDTQGKVTERKTLPGSEIWLDNTVAGHLYPSLKVALVTVPTEMMEWNESANVACMKSPWRQVSPPDTTSVITRASARTRTGTTTRSASPWRGPNSTRLACCWTSSC